MNNEILDSVKQGKLVLFLGAGASRGCKSTDGTPLLMAGELAERLAKTAGFTYSGEPLDQVYEAVKLKLGSRLDEHLERAFRHVQSSAAYNLIATYPWRRIYTLNIDDGLDTALVKLSKQKVRVLCAQDAFRERNPFFEELELIKLNGSIDRLKDGLIFSPSEYAQATAKHLPWYTQCASDFLRSPILFVGTKLSEPLLKFHIERYQSVNSMALGTSYLVTPSASEIEIAALKRYKIDFIPGTLEDFAAWLQKAIPEPPSPTQLAEESIPQLKAMFQSGNPRRFASLFEEVTAVKPGLGNLSEGQSANTVKEFYKGFKPTWVDIATQIPAELDSLAASLKRIADTQRRNCVIPILGPAGSGKTTLLKQICWKISQTEGWDVFFIEAEPYSLPATLDAIESTSKADNVLVAIDNLELSIDHIQASLTTGRLQKTLLIGAEREAIWNRRGRYVLADHVAPPILARDFSEKDADKLLQRLQHYGTWTRLGKLSEKERKKELLDRAQKQLLIALLEATLGRGFEQIIEDDYKRIGSEEEKLFLTIVALATDRRCDAPVSLIDRAMDKMGIVRGSGQFAQDLAGIVSLQNEKIVARHPVYARYLVDRVIDPALTYRAIDGLLQAFADYAAPVIKHVRKSEANLYKSLINHRFLFDVLRGQENLVVGVYAGLEKKYESDGLFWLQYGLSLRDFRRHDEALDKLKTAHAAYPMLHTEHALAQQMLLVAMGSSDRTAALNQADEAKKTLERLDSELKSDDTYPIVTLADMYTAVVRIHRSPKDARVLAKTYSEALQQRLRQNPTHTRLRVSYERMFKFASTGNWTDITEDDYVA